MKRGDIWWTPCDLAFEDDLWQGTSRPVALLSSGDAPEVRAMWIVAPAKGDIRGLVVELTVGREEGLPRDGVLRVALPQPGHILCDWLTTLESNDLLERAGALSHAKIRQLEENLRSARIDPSRWAG